MQLQHSKNPGTAPALKRVVLLLFLLVTGGTWCGVCQQTVPPRKSGIARLQIAHLEGALGLFYWDVGRHPTTREGLSGLISNPGLPNWHGPYLEKMTIPKDPWGGAFQYRSPGDHGEYDLWSLGGDGLQGGSERDADAVSW